MAKLAARRVYSTSTTANVETQLARFRVLCISKGERQKEVLAHIQK